MISYNYQNSPFSAQTTMFKDYLSNLFYYDLNQTMPPISNELWQSINSVFQSLNLKLNLITTTKYVDHNIWWYKMEPLSEEDINFFIPLLALELSLYPKSFISKLSLNQIVVCHSAIFHTDSIEQYRAAIPDYEYPTYGMIYCAKERSISYIRIVIHHELFHYYDQMHHGNLYQDDDTWQLFNPQGFKYGKGGWSRRTARQLKQNLFDYFITDYSTTGIEEDKAEIYSWMVTEGFSFESLDKREGVIGKCVSIKCMMEEFDKEGFWQGKGDFWNRALLFKKTICNNFYGNS